MDAIRDIDLSDRGTQVLLAAGALGVGLLVAKLRGGGDRPPAPTQPVLTVDADGFGTRSDAQELPGAFGWVGFPPGTVPPAGSTGNDPTPQTPATTTTPAPVVIPTTPPPAVTTPPPAADPCPSMRAGAVISQAGKPYYCPAGSFLTWERGCTGNHVCQEPSGRQFQVRYGSPAGNSPTQPAPTQPAPTQPAPTQPAPSTLPYYCPSGSYMTKERNGSGYDVCQWYGSTEQFQVRYRAAGAAGDGGGGGNPEVNADWLGRAFSAGYSPVPVALHTGISTVVQGGESLLDIAARLWGNPHAWRRLLDLNPGIGDRPLTAGDVLRAG